MNQTHYIAIAILLGATLVSSAIFLSKQEGSNNSPHSNTATYELLRTENRAVYGNSEAETTIVEFSDFECPFCSRLHPTLKRIVDESKGSINWEYRNFPIPSHKSAELAAVIGECVLREKGNDAFWKYAEQVFANQEQVNQPFLLSLAIMLGLKESTLESCARDESITNQISEDVAVARFFGGTGTPFSVIRFPDGSTKPVSGALPYEQWVTIVQ